MFQKGLFGILKTSCPLCNVGCFGGFEVEKAATLRTDTGGKGCKQRPVRRSLPSTKRDSTVPPSTEEAEEMLSSHQILDTVFRQTQWDSLMELHVSYERKE